MYNVIELIYNSSLVLDNNGMLFYWPISIVSWSSCQLMWNYLHFPPLKPPKPALQWIYAHKHQIQWCGSLPYNSELLRCAGFDWVGHIVWDTGNGVYHRTSEGVPQIWGTLVDCYVNMNLLPQRIETPLPMHFLSGFQCRPLLFIVVSFVGVPSNVKSRPISPTKKY